MRPDLFILQNLSSINSYLFVFTISLILVFLLNRFIVGRYINGLAFFSFATAIVFAVIFNLAANQMITLESFLQFFYVDAALFIVVLFLYKKFISHAKQIDFIKITERLSRKTLALIIVLLVVQALINFMNVSWDGSSRIAFHEQRWFTFVRMVTQLLNPLSVFLVFLLIKCQRIFIAIFMALIIIVSTALAGSKAGFIIAFLEFFLLYRDLVGVTKREVRLLRVFAITLLTLAIINLYFMGISPEKLFERFVHYAEATIMVYPSDDPTAACKDTSMFAHVHRGIARLAGDPTAINIDTLFGYSLSIEYYGENSFTGPNARIGAYALCAFPGMNVAFLYTIIVLYLFFSWRVYLAFATRGGLGLLMICPFYVSVLIHIVMDYNTAMALLTEMIGLLLFLFFERLLIICSSRNTLAKA